MSEYTVDEAIKDAKRFAELGPDEYRTRVMIALAAEVERLRASVQFYKSRCDLLQQWQGQMRDPERTLVCDILANGQLLPDHDRSRYHIRSRAERG